MSIPGGDVSGGRWYPVRGGFVDGVRAGLTCGECDGAILVSVGRASPRRFACLITRETLIVLHNQSGQRLSNLFECGDPGGEVLVGMLRRGDLARFEVVAREAGKRVSFPDRVALGGHHPL